MFNRAGTTASVPESAATSLPGCGRQAALRYPRPCTRIRIASRVAYKIRGIGAPSLAILILTGAFMLSYRGVSWENILSGRFFTTSYGRVFGLKFVLVLILIGFQITIGNKPSKLNFGYVFVTLTIIALSVWLVRPVI